MSIVVQVLFVTLLVFVPLAEGMAHAPGYHPDSERADGSAKILSNRQEHYAASQSRHDRQPERLTLPTGNPDIREGKADRPVSDQPRATPSGSPTPVSSAVNNSLTPVPKTDARKTSASTTTPAQTTLPDSQKPAAKATPESTTVPKEKVAYLTFDDGPSPLTPQVLDILKQHGVKATFFVVGRNIEGREETLQRMVAEGHVIGGHTYSHDYRIIYRDAASFYDDLERGNQLIEQVTGKKPAIFRFPGGSTNTISQKYQDPTKYGPQQSVMTDIIKEAEKRGYLFIDWNVENGDARPGSYTTASSVNSVKQQVQNKRDIVVLMHDSAPKAATVQSLPAIIHFLKEQGYTFAPLSADPALPAVVRGLRPR